MHRALFLCLLLFGCAPRFESAPVTQTVTPAVSGDAIIARDGARLPLQRWDAEGQTRAVIVAVHGMSDYSNAFAMPAKVWAKDGITTLAYDQRGFGRSPDPGAWAGADVMRRDLADAVAAARARYPNVPVFALGESMGGAVVLTALASSEPPRADASADAQTLKVDGAILSAPAVWSRADMPLTYRAALFLAAHLVPGLVLSNNAGARIAKIQASDNIPMLIALGKDPLFQKRTRVETLYGLVDLMDEARTAPARLGNAPLILLMTGRHDQLIPPAPTEAVIAGLGTRATIRRYDDGWHMLLRDLEGDRVAQDVADWVLRNK